MNERIGILGGGESGVGAAILAKKLGMTIWVSDANEITPRFKQTLLDNGISFEEKGHNLDRLLASDLVVKSPGIPDSAAIVTQIREQNIEVISELEFAFRHSQGKMIAITGSNGKTTTTQLVYHLMNHAGMDVSMNGNIGFSIANQIAVDPKAWYVVEVSSFQLDNVSLFRPDIAILLNITPDHLDRYSYSFELYAQAKWNLVAHQNAADLFIYSADDEGIEKTFAKDKIKAKTIAVSAQEMPKGFVQLKNGQSYSLTNKYLQGRHNQLNAACAIEAVLAAGVDPSSIQTGLDTFVNAPHRLEEIAIVDGVRYVNDSKATNVDAVFYGLGAVEAPVIWIAGGLDKGNDYTALERLVEVKVKALICLGLDNTKLKSYYGSKIAWIREAKSAQEAVNYAVEIGESGDTVLLSPACASFDLFRNYEDRGDQFRLAVQRLIHPN